MKALLTVRLVLSLLWFAGSVWGVALPAGEYMVYDSDTAGEANVLLNYGTASVDVVVTDGVGDANLDILRIDCNVAGSVKLWSSGELCGTGGVLITDSAAVDLTLTTGVISVGGTSLLDWDTVSGGAQPAVHWTAGSVAHVTNTAYRAGVTNIAVGAPATANLLAALDGNADINRDGVVDLEDAAILAQQWLQITFTNIYTFNLDATPAWDTQGQWVFGQPVGGGGVRDGNPDPASGRTGNNVYGVNLNGDYDPVAGGPYYLTAGPFDCSLYSSVQLRFAR